MFCEEVSCKFQNLSQVQSGPIIGVMVSLYFSLVGLARCLSAFVVAIIIIAA